jgi:DNA (cytosine-5)-methyltransferase 1
MLTVGSLFSGIGGLDLGLERASMKVIWQSEIDPYCNKVLKKHWPEVPNYGNIKEIDWSRVPRPDVICGGYPCQPFSTAGKRRGTDDPRHLWPWVRDAISNLRPRYAILENVRGHLTMGGTTVIGELAEIGYDAEWRIVSAAGMGAPHRRERIIIVAYPQELHSDGSNNNSRISMESETISKSRNGCRSQNVAYPNDARGGTPERGIDSDGSKEIQEWQNVAQFGISRRSAEMAYPTISRCQAPIQQAKTIWPTDVKQSDLQERSYNGWWETEPDVGRVADGISNRVDRLRGLGNAVVPQVAEYIGRLVVAAELNNS